MKTPHQLSAGLRARFIVAVEIGCAAPLCIVHFVPRREGQRYCSAKCALEVATRERAGYRRTRLDADALALAADMLAELDGAVLEVVLTPGRDFDADFPSRGLVRAAEYQNPKWFQEFCSAYQTVKMRRHKRTGRLYPSRNAARNHHTVIDKRRTISALRRLVTSLEVSGVYGERLEDFIQRQSEKGALSDAA